MMQSSRGGFSVFELPVVVVIMVVIIAMAAPKWTTPNASARVAALRADLHNAQVAEEAFYSDKRKYGTVAELQAASRFELSQGNRIAVTVDTSGYAITISNPATGARITRCSVQIGAGATTTVDGLVVCS